MPKAPSSDKLGFAGKPNTLSHGEATGFAAELFEENTVFFLAVSDYGLLVSVHPAAEGDEEKLGLSCHGVEKFLKVPAAQSARLPWLIFSAVQDSPPPVLRRKSLIARNPPPTGTCMLLLIRRFS